MTLSTHTQTQIIEATNAHWTQHTRDESFAELISGKEPGHRMADYVDDRTCALLKVTLDTRYEGNGRGAIRKRSIGDIFERQLVALFENRQRRLNEQRTLAREFERVEFIVDQSQMEFIL